MKKKPVFGVLHKPLVIAFCCIFALSPVRAEVKPASAKTTVFNHPSGVPVVNIAKPNASGLSHNIYSAFNVPSQGLVLNNATSVTMSQLAGSVPVNSNLGGRAASVILNEVVSANRSQLNGYLEVAGQQADVIVANPYGVTCNGCGFINTPRVTLTTGAPTLGSDGSLSGFLVNSGDMLINGSGLNASAQDILDLVARSVVLDGQVNGQDVRISAGAHQFDYGTRNATGPLTADGAPSYAIDSTALGGLYANRIRLIATEQNVGVRMLGDVAATADDLVLTSAGKIELRNKVSAARDISVMHAGTQADEAAITLHGGASLSAGRDLAIDGGGLLLNGGLLGAGADLTLTVASLAETGSGQRFAGDELRVSTGAAALNGGIWDAGGELAFAGGSVSVGSNGAAFYAGRNTTAALSISTDSGDLALTGATIKNSGIISLSSAAGLSLGAGAEVQSGDQINLAAVTTLQNSGILLAAQNIVLRSANTDGTLAATLGGEVRAGNLIDIAGAGTTPDKAVDVVIAGTVVGQQLQIRAEDVVVSGLLQGTAGTTLAADTLLISGSGARLIASDTDDGMASLTVGSLTNQATLQAAGNLTFNIGNLLHNTSGASLLAGGDITVRSTSAADILQVSNAGTLQAGTPTSGSALVAGKRLDVAGYDQGSGPNSAVNFSNSGDVFADLINLNVTTLNNSRLLAANSQSTINVLGVLTNSSAGRLLLTQQADGNGVINVGSLQNQGAVESAGALRLSAGSAVDNNGGKIVADGQLTVRAATAAAATFTNQNNGVVQSASKLDIGGQETAPGVVSKNLSLSNSGTMTGRQVNVTAGTATNSGTVQAGAVVNGVYSKGAGDRITLNVGAFSNSGAGAKLLAQDADITADTVFNQGVIHAGNALAINSARLDNDRTGGISGLNTATINTRRSVGGVSNELNNFGLILSNGALTLGSANVIRNRADGTYTGEIYASGNLTISADQQLVNQGKLESVGDLSITARTIENSIPNPGKHWVVENQQKVYEGDSGRYGGTHNGRWGRTNAGDIFPKGMYYVLGIGHRVYEDYRGSYELREVFNSPVNTALRPQMLASNITIGGFDYFNNTGGLLSAGSNITLTGRDGNSRFVNQSLNLYHKQVSYTGREVYDCTFFGDAACADTAPAAGARSYLNDEFFASSEGPTTRYGGISSGLRANGRIRVNVAHVDNSGSPYDVEQSVGAGSGPGSKTTSVGGSGASGSIGSGTAVNLSGGDQVGLGLNLSLPTNPNGFFVVSKNPSSDYLIETNPLFGLDAAYLGSDYLATKLNIPTDQLQRRLGDAAYENQLVRQQLIAQTGFNLMEGLSSEASQMQMLLDNAARTASDLKLSFGVALTAEQVAALTTDIVWMVEQVVAGQRVLAPVVYLSQSTLDKVQHGAVITAGDIEMNVDTLTNTGGTITAANAMSVIAKNDIRNTSGSIGAANMALVSTDGKIINETVINRAGSADNFQDVAGKTGTIAASGSLILSGNAGVDIIGAAVSAGTSAVLHSGSGDINIRSLALESKTTTEKHESDLFSSSSEKTVTTTQEKLGAAVDVGNGKNPNARLTLLAESGDVNLLSADLASSGGVDIKAVNVNSAALTLESSSSHSKSSSGIGSSGGVLTIGSSSAQSEEKRSTAVGSSIHAGGALNLLADKDIVLEGGTYDARTVSLEAGNDLITKAARDTYSSTSSASSAGLSIGNGSIGISAGSESGSESGITHSNAQIKAADGAALVARNKVDIGGVDIAVLGKAPKPAANTESTGTAAGDAPAPVPEAPAVALGLDVAKLRSAIDAGNATQFIEEAAASGMGVQAAMADMKQPEMGGLSISGQEIVSTKFQDEYQRTSERSGFSMGIGVQSGSTETGGSASIGFAAGTDHRKESESLKGDTLNHLAADNISLDGSQGISLKGVDIAGSSSVVLKSEGDISITAAEVQQQHTLESHSSHLGFGVTTGADTNSSPLNVTGPLSVAANIGFGVDTKSLDRRDNLHVDSTLSSGGLLAIESGKGNVTWTGVTATADALDIRAENFRSAAYEDSSSVKESGTSLGINLNLGTDIGAMASTLFKGNGSRSTTLDRKETAEVGNTIVAGSVNLDVRDNVTLVGGNVVADDIRIRAKTVDVVAEKSTLDEHKTEVGVSLVMDGSAAFMGDKAWASVDSLKGSVESGVSHSSDHAERTGEGRVNNGKAVSDELLAGRTGLSITSTESTTRSESYRNATLQFGALDIDTTASAKTGGDGHVDIGGANLLGTTAASSINIATGELKTTKYVDRREVTTHDNSTFVGVAVEGHSAIADTINHDKTLQDKIAQGMTVDEGWVAAQRAADASNIAMGDAAGGSVSATVRNIDTKTHSVSTSENTTYLNAGTISIRTTEGNLALNGVEFNAPPVYNKAKGVMEKATGPRPQSISLESAKDISMTAAKSTHTETSTTLTNDFNVTGAGSISGSGSGVGVDVGYNGSFENNSLARTTYSNASLAADNVSIKSKNLSLTGANVSGGTVSIDVEKDITITSVQDTQQQNTTRGNWGGSVGLNTTTIASVNGQGGGGDSHDNYAQTAQQSGIAAEQRLDVTAGGNMTLTGARLASAGGGSVSVKGDLSVNKLDDFREKDGLFAGASGGINQGGANAGINLEKVDQIHNATTQNSTISGVGLTVGGKTQGDNLQADGSLQTQATTVLRDEKIAGVYVNGTGVGRAAGVKRVVDEAVGMTGLLSSPKPLVRPDAIASADGGIAMPARKAEGPAMPLTDATHATPAASKYDTNVVIVTLTKDGKIDTTVKDSAQALAAKHADDAGIKTIVLIEKEGGGFVNPDALAGASGTVRVNVVGHGGDLKGDAARVAGLVETVGKSTNGTSIEKVGLVACGTCLKDGEESLGATVTALLYEKGLTPVVSERSGALQVNADGTKSADNTGSNPAMKYEYSMKAGVVEKTEQVAKRQETLTPGRTLNGDTEQTADSSPSKRMKPGSEEPPTVTQPSAGAVAASSAAQATAAPAKRTIPDGIDMTAGAHTVIGGKGADKNFVVDAKGTFAESGQPRQAPPDYAKVLAVKSAAAGKTLATKLAGMDKKALDESAARLKKLSQELEKLGQKEGLLDDHGKKVADFSTALLEGKEDLPTAYRKVVPDADEVISTATTLGMFSSMLNGQGKAEKEKLAPVIKELAHFMSAIRQPTKNVQATIQKDGSRVGVIHPTSREEHPDKKSGNQSEHIYADKVRADLFLSTLELAQSKGMTPDEAVMVAAVKAMQFTLSSMELSFTAGNVDASAHGQGRKDEQNRQREVLKRQIDEVLAHFGIEKPTATQEPGAQHNYDPKKHLERTHSDFRIQAPPAAQVPSTEPGTDAAAPQKVPAPAAPLPLGTSSFLYTSSWRQAA